MNNSRFRVFFLIIVLYMPTLVFCMDEETKKKLLYNALALALVESKEKTTSPILVDTRSEQNSVTCLTYSLENKISNETLAQDSFENVALSSFLYDYCTLLQNQGISYPIEKTDHASSAEDQKEEGHNQTDSSQCDCIHKYEGKNYPSLFKHLKKYHTNEDTEKIVCPYIDCNEKGSRRPSAIAYHMIKKHQSYKLCCNKLFSEQGYEEHIQLPKEHKTPRQRNFYKK